MDRLFHISSVRLESSVWEKWKAIKKIYPNLSLDKILTHKILEYDAPEISEKPIYDSIEHADEMLNASKGGRVEKQ